jgi:hypothetical protein
MVGWNGYLEVENKHDQKAALAEALGVSDPDSHVPGRSDTRAGIKAAIPQVLTGATW